MGKPANESASTPCAHFTDTTMKGALMSSLMQESAAIWVFAYGSLLWKPCFHYHRKVVGHIKGFKRRFFQGNTNLRGSVSQPGRVAILVPDEQEATWGVAYEIKGQEHVQHALEHLYVRENTNGGYHTMLNTFHPRASSPPLPHHHHDVSETDGDVTVTTDPFTVITFTATPASHLYMGSADTGTMARQVVAARGDAGTNAEYVLRTAEYVREHIPEDQDHHLFSLEKEIRELLAAMVVVQQQRQQQQQQQQQRRQSLRRRSSVLRDITATPALQVVTAPV